MNEKMVIIDDEELEIHAAKYTIGNGLYIGLSSANSGEPFGVLSINLFGHPDTNIGSKIGGLKEDEFVVNHDWLGTPSLSRMLDQLLSSGLFKDTGKRVCYGFCKNIPVWKYLG